MSDIPPSQTSEIAPPIQLTLAVPAVPMPPEKTAAQERFAVRLWCAFVFAMCAAMLAVGLKLTPSADGTGTHEQMGLPPCGMLAATGYPCPTCGCTTAVSNFAHGHLIRSFLTQPFGFAVALLATLLVPATFWGVVTGKWLGPSMFWLSWHWHSWVYGSIAILVLGWIYKIIVIRNHLTF